VRLQRTDIRPDYLASVLKSLPERHRREGDQALGVKGRPGARREGDQARREAGVKGRMVDMRTTLAGVSGDRGNDAGALASGPPGKARRALAAVIVGNDVGEWAEWPPGGTRRPRTRAFSAAWWRRSPDRVEGRRG
jgi:hypothetical protein